MSKSYSSDPAAQDNGGADAFHFLPETETIEIHYQIDDPYAAAAHGTLELFTRFENQPLWSLDLATLGDDWLSHGKHVVTWDGRLVTPNAGQEATPKGEAIGHDLTAFEPDASVHPAFPDGYLTLEYTPYMFRLTLTADSTPELSGTVAEAWTYFHLLIKGYEFALGEEATLPGGADRDKTVRRQIATDGGVPAGSVVRKVVLTSNLFSKSDKERADNTAFEKYQTAWGDGPNIPVIAKIRMATSAGAEVKLEESAKGAVALGRARFLWDWEDPDEILSQGGKPQAFISAATDYYKATTKPKGDNCHKDHGGKRGAGAAPVFPAQTGYDPADRLQDGNFPFQVEAATGRPWAAFTRAWTRGKLKGCTGVVFQPSRIAGDDYRLTIYLAYDRTAKDKLTLDVDTEPLAAPDPIKAQTGLFQVWRAVNIARYIRKAAAVPDLTPQWSQAANTYKDAYIDLRYAMSADDNYLMAEHCNPVNAGGPIDYNRIVESALAETDSLIYTAGIVVDEVADHASVAAAFKIRPYTDMVAVAHAMLHQWLSYEAKLANASRNGNDTVYEVDLEALSQAQSREVKDHEIPRMAVISVKGTDFDRGAALVSDPPTASAVTVRGVKASQGTSNGGGGIFLFLASLDFPATESKTGERVEDQLNGLAEKTIPAPIASQPVSIAPGPGVARSSNITVIGTARPHGLEVDNEVSIAGVPIQSFNVTAKVKAVESTTAFSIENKGADEHSGGGACTYKRELSCSTTSAVRASDVVTFTTAANHGLKPDDRVTLTAAPFAGDYVVKSATDNSFTADSRGADAEEANYSGPILKTHSIPIAPAVAVPGIIRANNNVTVTTTSDHGLKPGDSFSYSGVVNSYFNGTCRMVQNATATTFEYPDGQADLVSGGGTVTKEDDEIAGRFRATQKWLQTNKFTDKAKYGSAMSAKLAKVLGKAGFGFIQGGKRAAATDGITVVHYRYVHDQEGNDVAGTSEYVPDATRNKCVVFLFHEPLVTLVHEAGHHLFLPHARYPTAPPEKVPSGPIAERHDDDDDKCTMSYNDPTRSFCGLCQLRLRGWSAARLDKDDAVNTKS